MLLRTRSRSRFVNVLLVAGLALAFATPAAAGTVYSWVTEDGTYSYADSLKGVPKAYRSKAKSYQMGKLKNYSRYTPSDSAAKGVSTDRLAANLDRLRANAAASHAAEMRVARQSPTLNIRTSRSGGGIDVPMGGQGPIVVEKVRTRLKGDMSTRHYTIVRQGGEVVAVYKGADNSRRINEVHASELFDYRAADETSDW